MCSLSRYHLFDKKTLNAIEFKEAVEKITKLKISGNFKTRAIITYNDLNISLTDRESEYLFTMFDSNNDGNIDIAEELNIRHQ